MSLSEQLKQLQIPGQSVIQQISSKRVSILFDAVTAASLDNDAILIIGRSGYDELVSIDQLFHQFESFFEKDSAHFQRNSLTKKENKIIKKKISDFLLYLSPYLLLKPTQKILEWLVRRFQIHIFDKDAFMACVLPFHETGIFARIIQLFGTKESGDMWDWLLPCQKEGTGFNTQTLVKHCKDPRNRNLLNFICRMATNANDALTLSPKSGMKSHFSFCARTLACVLDSYTSLKENLVSILLPQIHAGLQSNSKDFISATYMIIGMICMKTKLSKDVCKAFISTVIKSMQGEWYEEGLLCILSIITHQQVKVLSNKALDHLLALDLDGLMKELVLMQYQYDLELFIKAIIPPACKQITSESGKELLLLKQVIDEIHLSENMVNILVRELIKSLISKINENEDNMTEVARFVKTVATRFSSQFDAVISDQFEVFHESEDQNSLEALQKVISICLSTTKHQILATSELPLIISINHPETSIRCSAVNQLFDSYEESVDTFDEEFYRQTIMSRFADDSVDVVVTLLKYSKQIVKILSLNEIIEIVQKLMQRTDRFFNLNDLLIYIIKNFGLEKVNTMNNSFTYVFLRQMIYGLTGKRHKKIVESLTGINVSLNRSPILNGILKTVKSIDKKFSSKSQESVIGIIEKLFSNITDEILNYDNGMEELKNLWAYKNSLSTDHDMHLISLILLDSLVSKKPDYFLYGINYGITNEDFTEQDSLELFKTFKSSEKSSKFVLIEFFKLMKSERSNLPIVKNLALLNLLRNLINKLADDKGGDHEKIRCALFETISIPACDTNSHTKDCFRYLLNEFIVKLFSSKDETLYFFYSIYEPLLLQKGCSEENIKSAICALSLSSKLISAGDGKILEGDKQGKLIAATIALLHHEEAVVREVALKTLQAFYDIVGTKKTFKWNYLLVKIVDAQEEIICDMEHIKRVFENTLTVKKMRSNEFENLMKKSRGSKSTEKQLAFSKFYIQSLLQQNCILQLRLVELLEHVQVEGIWDDLVYALTALLNGNAEYSLDEEKIIISLLNHLNEDEFIEISDDTVESLVKCIESSSMKIRNTCLNIIADPVYSKLSSESQSRIVSTLLKMLLYSKSVIEATSIRVVLKSIKISSDDVSSFVTSFCNEIDQFETSSNTLNQTSNEKILENESFRSMIELLEAVHASESFDNIGLLVKSLFSIFERLLKLNDPVFEYHTQLCLTILHNLMKTDEAINISSEKFKTDLLIRCLQGSKDLQTSQQCLKVLSTAAFLYPTQVLHAVMHIFTFIGGNMLRVDNQYTYNVIEKTIESIVPVLVKRKNLSETSKKRGSSDSVEEIVLFILETFIDSLPHCPEHRRVHILSCLLRVIGVDEYFHLVILLLLKKLVKTNKQKETEVEEMEVSPITLDFCKHFFTDYSISKQLNCMKEIIVWLNNSHVSNQDSGKKQKLDKGLNVLLFNIENLAEKQSKILHYTIMAFASEILESEHIISAYELLDNEAINNLTNAILSLLEELLQYTEKLGKRADQKDDSKSARFNSSMLNKSQKLVGILYSLLPFDSFINVILGLIEKENHLIRKKSLELLSSKLNGVNNVPEEQEVVLLDLFKKLLQLSKYKENDTEPPFNKQLMLFTIKQLAILLCEKYKKEFTNAVPVIVQLYSVEEGNLLVSISAILCIAEFSVYLKADMLPYLPILMKPLFGKISSAENVTLNKNYILLLETFIVTIQKFLSAIPQFLSSYIPEIIQKISYCDQIKDSINESRLNEKIDEVLMSLGKCVPARVLYPCIETGIANSFTENKEKQIPTYLQIFKHSFSFINKQDANKNFSKILQSIIKKALCARAKIEEISLILSIEDVAIEAFCKLVLKLSENTLRPLYLGLFTWATADEEKHLTRILSFYRLSAKLSGELKSLYLLFVSHILKHATDVLINITSKNETDNENEADLNIRKELVINVIDTLSNVCYYDHQGFIDKDKFESLMKPILDQLENELFTENYEDFISNHLCGCIVNFAAAVNDATCWKALNHHQLLKTKNMNVKVRLAALRVTQEIYIRLGESYMILVPETIPYLAEVLEDDSMEVENMGHKVIKQIEEITGESLQKYF